MIKLTRQKAIRDIQIILNELSPYDGNDYLCWLYRKLRDVITRPDMYYSDTNQAYLAAEALERLIQHEIFGVVDDNSHKYKYLIE